MDGYRKVTMDDIVIDPYKYKLFGRDYYRIDL